MYIGDIVNNSEFYFNAPFRVVKFVLGVVDELDEYRVMYDSTVSPDFPFDLAFTKVSEIRAGEDGILEFVYE